MLVTESKESRLGLDLSRKAGEDCLYLENTHLVAANVC